MAYSDATLDDLHNEFVQALLRGDERNVKALLERHPWAVSAKGKFGHTLLHIAATEEQVKVQSLLLQAGADPNATADDGSTPLHIAAYSSFVGLLVKNGAKIDIQNYAGDTPLHAAASEAEGSDVVAALVRLGARTAIKNKRGETPLDIARSRGDLEKVRILSRVAK